MKYVERGQYFVDVIADALFTIEWIYKQPNFTYLLDYKELYDRMVSDREALSSLDTIEIDKEFWESCTETDKIPIVKRIYEVKFARIIHWASAESGVSLQEYCIKFRNELYEFNNSEQIKQLPSTTCNNLNRKYRQLIFAAFYKKRDIHHLLHQWEAILNPGLEYTVDSDFLHPPAIKGVNKIKSEIKVLPAPKAIATTKTFENYLLHPQKEQLANALRENFTTEKGKAICILMEVMKTSNPPLLTLARGEGMAFYEAMKVFFNQDIGTYNSIFNYTITGNDSEAMESMKTRLNFILEQLK
jgi:hypothetical protein